MVKRFDEAGYGMVIADGMGKAGEEASRLAISTLVDLAINFGRWNVRVNEPIADEMMDRAERFYRGVDATLRQAGRNRHGDLETTVTAVYSAGTELFFAHVGHSRVYLFRDNELMQLTRDHTVERERPGRASIVDVAASSQDRRHIVTRTLGRRGASAGSPTIDVERCGLADGDAVLLCNERAHRRRRGRRDRHGAAGAQVAGRPLPGTGGTRRLRRMHRRCDRHGGELWHPRTSRRRPGQVSRMLKNAS